jgi:hypothetical protein
MGSGCLLLSHGLVCLKHTGYGGVLMIVLVVIGSGLRKVSLARDVRGVNGPKVVSGPH